MRVDLATGQVVDWQPPAPPDTDMVRHEWNTDTRWWTMRPTALAIEHVRREAVVRRIEQVEAQQARPMRELVLDPQNLSALAKLKALDRHLADLRAALASPPP